MQKRLEKILETYLKELEEAKVAQIRMDNLVLVREQLQNMNMLVEYDMKLANLANYKKEKDIE